MELKAVKEVISKRKLVTYDKSSYTATAYILRFNGREWQHTLELKDLKVNGVRIVPIGKVEVENE
jgi:hypothetical protein